MPTTKKKKSTKTAKKPAAKRTYKKSATKTCCKSKNLTSKERAHICFVAALAIATGILLCADAAMMIVA